MRKSKNSSNQVRIIGGQWRGRKLSFPDHAGLRPTGDRIRETLFNWLTGVCHDANCLDLYAGSGALGWEAISRGAKHCTLVENSAQVLENLKQQARSLNTDKLQFTHQEALEFLNQAPKHTFDIVFIDPPFADKTAAQECLNKLISEQHLAENAFIYIEQDAQDAFPSHNCCELYRHKHAAQVQYGLLKYCSNRE